MLKNFALRVTIIYMIVAGLYIMFSDNIVLKFTTDPAKLTVIQTYKGWGYVIVTGLLIYFLIQNQLAKLKKTDTLLKKTEELNKKLNKINNELKELDLRRNIFISSMGHELRTPLNSIIGFTDVLLKEYSGKLNEEQKKQLTIVKDSSRHLLSLINELIDVGKIEIASERLSLGKFDLQKLIYETIESLKPIAEKKGIAIQMSSKSKVEILSDEKRVRQILINFINNGIKFTDKGGIDVDVIDGEDFVHIIIKDTGIGMSKEDIKYLFEPFSIGKFKNRPDVEGAGLGLYICNRIINLLHGEVFVESELNKGTKFTIKLPKKLEVR
ncbi:MAG: HAMP domain-containing sensor histidine kinase [candidate division WOR-3 bacterium]